MCSWLTKTWVSLPKCKKFSLLLLFMNHTSLNLTFFRILCFIYLFLQQKKKSCTCPFLSSCLGPLRGGTWLQIGLWLYESSPERGHSSAVVWSFRNLKLITLKTEPFVFICLCGFSIEDFHWTTEHWTWCKGSLGSDLNTHINSVIGDSQTCLFFCSLLFHHTTHYKILEKVVYIRFSHHLDTNNTPYPHKYCFHENTPVNILCCNWSITSYLHYKIVPIVLLYLKKHLIQSIVKFSFQNLVDMEFREVALKWLTGYFDNREQFVCLFGRHFIRHI